MAPSTPPPPSRLELAAFTTASTSCSVMSPRTSTISGTTTIVRARRVGPARVRSRMDAGGTEGVGTGAGSRAMDAWIRRVRGGVKAAVSLFLVEHRGVLSLVDTGTDGSQGRILAAL